MLIYRAFTLWSSILLKCEERRLLHGTGSIPSNFLALVQSILSCLVGFNEAQLMELTIELFVHRVTIHSRLVGDGNLHLKSMKEWCIHQKNQKFI
jgi:hypothetical protein